jgi:hypothetical protein
LIAVLAENVQSGAPSGAAESWQVKRFAQILDELKIPWLNLYPEFAKRGDVNAARIGFDPHWNAQGHQWAAESIFDYLKREGYLISNHNVRRATVGSHVHSAPCACVPGQS